MNAGRCSPRDGWTVDVVAAVEAQRAEGHTPSRRADTCAGRAAEMLASVRRPQITVHLPDREPDTGRLVRIRVQRQPLDLRQHQTGVDQPGHQFDTGLGVFATTTTSFLANLMLLRRMLSRTPEIRAGAVPAKTTSTGCG